MGFTSPGAMAGNAIQQFLAQREMANRQRMIDELTQAQQAENNSVRQRELSLREGQEARIGERQAQMDAQADTERQRTQSEAANAAGMRRFTGDAMKMPGVLDTPEGARGLAGDIYGEGGQIPGILAKAMEPPPPDPAIARAASIDDYRAKKAIDQEFREPAAPSSQGTPEQQWVIRDGNPTPIAKGTARAGDQPYDAVAARSSQPVNTDEAVDTAREVQRIAGALKKHPGVGGAFGLLQSKMPTVYQSTADAEVLRDSLTSLLTLENMGKMKGVLSDADMKVLRAASSTISSGMSDEAAAAELDRISAVMAKVTGERPGQAPGAAGTSGTAPGAAGGVVKWGRGPDGRPTRLP